MPTKHKGGCHCRAVRFEFDAPDEGMVAWDCNCSICNMKRNTHVFIPEGDFRLLSEEDNLSCYQVSAGGTDIIEYLDLSHFETKKAKHLFCKTCGICCHYRPRSNPDKVAVTVHCVDADTPVKIVATRMFHGQEWEQSYETTGIGKLGSSAQQVQ